ncbi:MAG: hypothetical protein Q9213_000958 [Squamulea squamosa]
MLSVFQNRIRTSSQASAQDIDGWISQAKQLRKDIDTVQSSSRDILANARRNKELQQDVHDASSKFHLLEEELAFNQDLAATIENVRDIRRAIGQIQDLNVHGELLKAVDFAVGTEEMLRLAEKDRRIKAFGVLAMASNDLRQEIVKALDQRWHNLIRVDAQMSSISLPHEPQIASAMEKIGLLDEHVSDLASRIEVAILLPRLQLQDGMHERLLAVDANTLKILETSPPFNIHRLVDDLSTLVAFLKMHLPDSIVDPLSKVFTPMLIERLISLRLSTAIPEDLAALRRFNSTRDEILRFSKTINSHGWPGQDKLRAWVEDIPKLWVQQHQKSSLDCVRRLLNRGYGDIKTVERVETQVISQQDRLFTGNTDNDNWNAGWSDEDESSSAGKNRDLINPAAEQQEEDVSAWGLDDEEADGDMKAEDFGPSADSDDEHDAWGWGEDRDGAEGPNSLQNEPRSPSPREVNGQDRRRSQREVTLRESYNTTSLPAGILDLINSVISDMDELDKQKQVHPADQLRRMVQSRESKQGHIRFRDDIAALEAFGKRSYGKEMESQRTIIKDLLDGAQGFVNCTELPFSQECDLAVNTIVDRLRDIHKKWQSVLSYSALLQSVGSLLSTAIDKIIIDIEDMSDISEPESQRLTAYCKQVIALEDMFLPQQSAKSASSEEKAVPLTAVYVPGWFKFQYLSEILDSSLVDIKFLWTDGGLKLEYDTEEVVELIEALFADTEHRRRAIGEIRRSSGR